MGRIIGILRTLNQLKELMVSIIVRYRKIAIHQAKLIFYSLKLIFISINFITALVLIPAVVFMITYFITREFLIPSIVSLIAVAIYLIIMSSYFSKGVHKFGSSAKEIKSLYYEIRLEHGFILKSIRDDPTSKLLLGFLGFILLLELVLFFTIITKFIISTKIRSLFIIIIVLQAIWIAVEYMLSGIWRSEEKIKEKVLKKEKKEKENKEKTHKEIEAKKESMFDELIVVADNEEE